VVAFHYFACVIFYPKRRKGQVSLLLNKCRVHRGHKRIGGDKGFRPSTFDNGRSGDALVYLSIGKFKEVDKSVPLLEMGSSHKSKFFVGRGLEKCFLRLDNHIKGTSWHSQKAS
jgi:hypothetical protein